MVKEEFSKRWDRENGFTQEEALAKKISIDAAHGVNESNSKWNPSEIIIDLTKRKGFKVVIETKQ